LSGAAKGVRRGESSKAGREGNTADAADVADASGDNVRATTIQSVDRAAAVLKVLAGNPGAMSAIDVASAAGLDRTTVHRIMRTLIAADLVEARGASYRVGPACLGLGAARLNALNLREAAVPYAVDFQQAIVQDRPVVVSLSSYAGDEVVIVDRIWTAAVPLNIIMGIGWRFPIDATVSGRAMLSTMSEAQVERILGPARRDKLAGRLRAVRKREGLEWGMGEFHAGVGTLACPLLGPEGVAVGAMVVAGLGMEDELSETSEFAQNLRRSAQTVSRLLAASRWN
jgi:DNA-binding IclR family transcriptional regulator